MDRHTFLLTYLVINSELKEEIYMKQLENFKVLQKENNVCKLVKSIYGLKQTPK